MKRFQPTLLYFPYPPYWTDAAEVKEDAAQADSQEDWADDEDDEDIDAPAPNDDGYRDMDSLKNMKWDNLLGKAIRPYSPTTVTQSLDPASLR